MTDYIREKYVTWDQVQDMCRLLAQRIHAEGCTYNKILAITRGGLFPAGVLARELDIRHVDAICVDTYVGQSRGAPQILKMPAPGYLDEVILVDDLVDTGSTIKMLKEHHLKRALTVTIFAKPKGEALADLYQEKVPQDTWVRFPWDTVRQYVQPLVQRQTGS